jgi:hypothetical protein
MTSAASLPILRTVLVVLATYHLGIGVLSVASLRVTARVTARLYGLSVAESAPLRYAVRMLGLYALALGTLLSLAALAPATHRDVISVVAGLQLARAVCRLLLHNELATAFKLPLRRNVFNAVLLVGEAALLFVCLPVAP